VTVPHARSVDVDDKMPPPAPLLDLRGISKFFPGVKALDDVSFDLFPGEIHALIGENGAGKSTLIKIMSGVYRADSGEIQMNGNVIEVANPVVAQALGINYVPQEIGVEPFMTVAENIFLGRYPRNRLGMVSRRMMNRRAAETLRSLGLDLDPNAIAGSLSLAEKQMITIGRAVSTRSKLIIFDEATSSLTSAETDQLFRVIRDLKRQGIAMVYVTHRLDELFNLCDRVTILRDGKLISMNRVAAITLSRVISDMVGRNIEVHSPGAAPHLADKRLEVRHLSVDGALADINFELNGGEILGIAGLMGSGRTELARAIFGDLKISAGEIRIDGKVIHASFPKAAIDAGIALVPEDRKGEGTVLSHSVKANICGAVLKSLTRGGLIRKSLENRLARAYTTQLGIRTPSVDQEVRLLSGGNQQRVVLGKWLATHPRILIVDEPTRGIDVGAKAEIHALLSQLAEQGMAIIAISSELPEIIALSNRVLVMYRGTIQGELTGADITQDRIMRLATATQEEGSHVEN